MVRSSSDRFHCSDKKRGSAKPIKSWKITRLNNTLFYLFFPSWYSVCSECNPEGSPLLAPWSMRRHAGLSFTNLIIFFRNLSETKRQLTKKSFLSLELRGIQSLHVNCVYIDRLQVFWNWCLLGGFARKTQSPPGTNCELHILRNMVSNKNVVCVCICTHRDICT